MALDLRDTRRPGPRPRPGASRRASRSLAHPRGIPPVAAKAWETSALVRTPPASHRAPPNTATPPRSAMLRSQISRSIEFGRRREGTALPPAAELPVWACPSPIAPAILQPIAAPCAPLHFLMDEALDSLRQTHFAQPSEVSSSNSPPPPPPAAPQTLAPCGPVPGLALHKSSYYCLGCSRPWTSRTDC